MILLIFSSAKIYEQGISSAKTDSRIDLKNKPSKNFQRYKLLLERDI